MYMCKDCKSSRIKTRTNLTFGKKTTVTAVKCKDCGSANLEKREERKFRQRR